MNIYVAPLRNIKHLVVLFFITSSHIQASHHVERIAIAGSGCPAQELVSGSDYFIFGSWIIVTGIPNYEVNSGQDVPLRNTRKNCQINIRFQGPTMVRIIESYELIEADIFEDVSGEIAMEGSIQGSSQVQRSAAQISKDTLEGGSLQWIKHSFENLQSCENTRSINLNSIFRLKPSSYHEISKVKRSSYLYIKTRKESCHDRTE